MHTLRLNRLIEQAHAHDFDIVALVPGPSLFYLTGLSFHLSERPVVTLVPTPPPPTPFHPTGPSSRARPSSSTVAQSWAGTRPTSPAPSPSARWSRRWLAFTRSCRRPTRPAGRRPDRVCGRGGGPRRTGGDRGGRIRRVFYPSHRPRARAGGPRTAVHRRRERARFEAGDDVHRRARHLSAGARWGAHRGRRSGDPHRRGKPDDVPARVQPTVTWLAPLD